MRKITDGTIARTLVLALALLNQLLAALGKETINIAEDDVYQTVSVLFTIGAAAVAWWKNNSFTDNAIEADKYKEKLDKSEIR